MDQIDIFLERTALAREEKGLTERALSLVAGGPDVLRDARRKRSLPSVDKIRRMAEHLGVPLDYLLAPEGAAQPEVEPPVYDGIIPLRDRAGSWRGMGGPKDLPIWGTALGHDLQFGDDGEMLIEQTIMETLDPIRYVMRPLALIDERDAFGVVIQGDSMAPRFRHGEVGVVHPRLRVTAGQDVIVELHDAGEGDADGERVISVLIKEFVRQTASYYELRQHNPALTFRVPANRVKRVQRLMTPGELLGL